MGASPPNAIPFVDAHIHLWKLDHLRYPWLTGPFDDNGPNGSVEAIAQDYLPGDYARDLAEWNPVAAVHVDAGADGAQALQETQWLDGQAQAGGMPDAVPTAIPTAIVAFAALDDPRVDALLAAHGAYARVRGIRHIVNWHADPARSYTPRDLTQDPQWQAGYALLARHGLSFDLQCYPGQMAGLAPLIARHDDIPVIINHMGMPVLTDPRGLDEWRAGMRALAAIPHVAVKLSGLGFMRRDWDQALVLPLLRETVDLFGPARCMIASDTPTDKLFAPLARYLDTYRAFAQGFSLDEQRDLWGRNANRFYRLGLDL
jgi:predicted TIM-barrel fold metal-dependent hydrolase